MTDHDARDIDICRDLWLAVIERAVVDAIPHAPTSGVKTDVDRDTEHRAASYWITGPDTKGNFAWVCEQAGVTVHYVRRMLRDAISGKRVYLRQNHDEPLEEIPVKNKFRRRPLPG